MLNGTKPDRKKEKGWGEGQKEAGGEDSTTTSGKITESKTPGGNEGNKPPAEKPQPIIYQWRPLGATATIVWRNLSRSEYP